MYTVELFFMMDGNLFTFLLNFYLWFAEVSQITAFGTIVQCLCFIFYVSPKISTFRFAWFLCWIVQYRDCHPFCESRFWIYHAAIQNSSIL